MYCLQAVVRFCSPVSFRTQLQKGTPRNLSGPDMPLPAPPCNRLSVWRWATALHPLGAPTDMEMNQGQARGSGNTAALPTVGKQIEYSASSSKSRNYRGRHRWASARGTSAQGLKEEAILMSNTPTPSLP